MHEFGSVQEMCKRRGTNQYAKDRFGWQSLFGKRLLKGKVRLLKSHRPSRRTASSLTDLVCRGTPVGAFQDDAPIYKLGEPAS